jgi:hypothetical protein
MLRSQHLLPDRQGLPIEGFGLIEFALVLRPAIN